MIRTLWAQIGEYKRPALLTPLWMIGEVICEMVIPVLMGRIVDLGIYAGDMGYIVRTGLVMLGVALLGLLFGCLGAFSASKASTGLARNLRSAMFRKIQTYSFSNIDRFSTSSLITRMTTDTTNIQNAFGMLIRGAMRAPTMLIVAMTMSFILSPRLASIYLAAIAVLGIAMYFIMSTAARYFKQVFEKYDALNESVQENVNAIRVVKAYVQEDQEISRFKKAAANIYLIFCKAEFRTTFTAPTMNIVVYACIILISWFGAHMIVAGDLTTGALMSLLTYCMNVLMSLLFLAMIFVMLTMAEASARRICEVLTTDSDLTDPEDPILEVPDGSIRFDHVDFAYNKDSAEPVLKDIDLSIRAGETIGIIGATGSAKTSLVSLINRLYDVTEGAVYVGGHDVRSYSMEALREQVSVVLQKNELFSGTVYENLRWGNKHATDEECREAARIACADEFIEKMKDGYDTYIERGGANVSGGQKQRLCIARAILKKPKIIIFDDSTSAVDTATDARIRRGLAENIPDTTKIIIAQRVASVQEADRILIMDNGRVSDFDTHENLLTRSTIYREIHESQTGEGANADFDRKE